MGSNAPIAAYAFANFSNISSHTFATELINETFMARKALHACFMT
jgi:hypothetical protein